MARHIVTVEELQDWMNEEAWQVAASSSGHDSRKRLEMNNHGSFRVMDHGTITYQGGSLTEAVDAYNAAA